MKLIIWRMIKTQMPIHVAAPAASSLAVGVVYKRAIYSGLAKLRPKVTSSGKEAMIAADALASDDRAFTLRFRRKRARMMADRFDSTSDSDDPVSLWICNAVANIWTS